MKHFQLGLANNSLYLRINYLQGLVIILSTLSSDGAEQFSLPDVIFRGVSLTDEQVEDVKDVAQKAILQSALPKEGDMGELKKKIRSSVRNYLVKKLKINPMILPLITKL